ncbi:efflux RND transporter periplasmic adaptor subunit [Immundisolibacter sp.]|uniref:efflux RND transporter periplasmic adaptor subunit n=1 Tax=Immundisolibacter sp. TaxID=1934948 RepID=UPI00356ABDD3
MIIITRIAALLCAGVLLAACAPAPDSTPPPRPVRTVQVPAANDTTHTHSYAARVAARHTLALAFEVPGRITERRVEIGDRVAAGSVLARLDATDARLRERDLAARLTAAEAQHADAVAALRRAQDLRPKGFVSQAEFDRLTFQEQNLRAQRRALQAQLELARRALDYTTLRAPADGVVTDHAVELGQVVTAGQAAVELARAGELEAVFDVPEHLVPGLPDTLTVTLWAAPEQPLTAQVREVAPQAAGASRTYRVRASLPAVADGPRPRLGMSATVHVTVPAPQPALPASAIHTHDDGQPAVWVVDTGADGGHTVRLQPVQLGAPQGDLLTVSGGLRPGDRVVTAGVHDLHAGQAVSLP